jgi:hypothetical protein
VSLNGEYGEYGRGGAIVMDGGEDGEQEAKRLVGT